MNNQKREVGIILIATGAYDMFLQPLLDSMEKYFFIDHSICIYLFTDKKHSIVCSERIAISEFRVPCLKFPYPTLYRYKWISEKTASMKSDNIFYMDVDMLFVDYVGEEILPDGSGLVAVHHPGFYAKGGWGDRGTAEGSTAYIPRPLRKRYYAGGFQGGERSAYLSACASMAKNIDTDEKRGLMACWHDESHWNKYLTGHEFMALTPAYCMVEEMNLRERWGISHISPKIIALKKNHSEIRS
jgi:hypothetical protein